MFEFSVWFASRFGVHRLRALANQAKEDVKQHDKKVAEAKKAITDLAKNTRTYYFFHNPAIQDLVSLSTSFYDEDFDLQETLVDQESLENSVLKNQYNKILQDFLKRGGLSAKEKEVFMLRTGLLGVNDFTREDVGKNMDTSRQSILLLERSAMEKCKLFLMRRGFSVRDLR
jgi:DNA-directed RNA polymerase sigma subunit (sigma70/sigma32)